MKLCVMSSRVFAFLDAEKAMCRWNCRQDCKNIQVDPKLKGSWSAEHTRLHSAVPHVLTYALQAAHDLILLPLQCHDRTSLKVTGKFGIATGVEKKDELAAVSIAHTTAHMLMQPYDKFSYALSHAKLWF